MFKRVFALTLVLGLVLALTLPVFAQDDDPSAKAITFLLTMQNDDGGFTNGFVPESDLGTTADVIVAAVAAGQDPNAFLVGDMISPFTYLAMQVEADSVVGAGLTAKVLTAVIAAGKDPADFAGHNLIDDLLATQTVAGLLGDGMFEHCLAVIALQNAGADLPAGTVEALTGAQSDDGGWGFLPDMPSDTNTTGLCLQALALIEGTDAAVEAGFTYLAAIQNDDGGWPYQNPSEWGTDSDTSSTSLVVRALIAHEKDLAEWHDPQAWLLSMQLESGAFSYQAAVPGDNILATVDAIPAIEGVPLNAWPPEETEGE